MQRQKRPYIKSGTLIKHSIRGYAYFAPNTFDALEARAIKNKQSMNREIVAIVEKALQDELVAQ